MYRLEVLKSLLLTFLASVLFAAAAAASEPEFPGRVVLAVPQAPDAPVVRLGSPEEFDMPAAAVPRPLEALAARPLELPTFARQLAVREPAAWTNPAGPRSVNDWLSQIPALLTGPNLTIAGTSMLCLAGLVAGVALLLSSRTAKPSACDAGSATALSTAPSAATAPIPAAAEIISLLLRGGLVVEPEPIYFPRGARVYGRAIASAGYRVDAAHAIREPHFPVTTPAETSQPAWGDAVWISVRTLDGAEGPHFAPHSAAGDRRVSQPERSQR